MLISCWICGEPVEILEEKYHNPYNLSVIKNAWVKRKNLHKRIFCEKCKVQHIKLKNERAQLYKKITSQIMIEHAIASLEIQNVNVYKYRQSINTIIDIIEKNIYKFKSSHEIVLTTIFIYHQIEYSVNFKIGKYTVDFYLPTFKVILEVDGHLHNLDINKVFDANRDIELRNLLGSDWEVLHIPTKYVDSDAEKIPFIITKMKSAIQKARSENSGILPETFAKRYKSYYCKVLRDKGGVKQ